jgi:ElaB/YqjD/DUF883 family membrane-anchored ribosome-binding protein
MEAKDIKDSAENVVDRKTYEDAIARLTSEKDRLERELKKEYRSARRYVRTNPEQGIGASLVGGLLIGFIVAKLLD